MDGRFSSAHDMGDARGESRTGDWARHAGGAAPDGVRATSTSRSAKDVPEQSGFELPASLTAVVDIAYAPWFRYPHIGEHPALIVLTNNSGPRLDFVEPGSPSISHAAKLDGLADVCCIAWDGWGVRLGAAVAGGESIVRVDPYLGTTYGRVQPPAKGGNGLAYDGRHLLYATARAVHALDPESAVSSWKIPTPSSDCLGLASGDGIVYFASGQDVMVHGMAEASGWAPFSTGSGRITGIAHDPRSRRLYITRDSTMQVSVIPIGD